MVCAGGDGITAGCNVSWSEEWILWFGSGAICGYRDTILKGSLSDLKACGKNIREESSEFPHTHAGLQLVFVCATSRRETLAAPWIARMPTAPGTSTAWWASVPARAATSSRSPQSSHKSAPTSAGWPPWAAASFLEWYARALKSSCLVTHRMCLFLVLCSAGYDQQLIRMQDISPAGNKNNSHRWSAVAFIFYAARENAASCNKWLTGTLCVVSKIKAPSVCWTPKQEVLDLVIQDFSKGDKEDKFFTVLKESRRNHSTAWTQLNNTYFYFPLNHEILSFGLSRKIEIENKLI